MTNTKIIMVETCESTQEYARNLFKEEKTLSKILVVADNQTAGKGRGENNWESESGQNLLCTFVYPFREKAEKQSYISRAVSLALCDMMMLYSGNYAIKWPNDILLDGKKIAGILIEHNVSGVYLTHSLIGIGLNVNQEQFPSHLNATSLIHATGTKFRIRDIIRTLLSCLESRLSLYESHKWNELDNLYHARLLGYKLPCRFRDANNQVFSAINKGVDAFGRMILEQDGRETAYDLNDVHMLLPL